MKKILVIDDDAPMRSVLRRNLERAGFAVSEAENGLAGRKIFSSDRVDLVITDIIMPEVEGIELIQGLRRLRPDIRIIAISGGGRVASENYLELAEVIGAEATFAKPFGMDRLISKVNELLGVDPEA